MKTRLLASALFVGLSTSGSVLPPSASAEYSRDPYNSLRTGATSIQFLAIGGASRPSFRPSGLYLKWHMSDRNAFRLGTDFSLDESSGKNSLPIPSPPYFGTRTYQNDRNYSVSVSAEFERYVDATGPVTIFVGFGPFWSRGRAYYDETVFYDSYPIASTQTYLDEQRSWEVGASASIGFEWFFKRKLSLLGRVGGNLGFGERHQNRRVTFSDGAQTQLHVDRFDTTTAEAGIGAAAIGAAVYF